MQRLLALIVFLGAAGYLYQEYRRPPANLMKALTDWARRHSVAIT